MFLFVRVYLVLFIFMASIWQSSDLIGPPRPSLYFFLRPEGRQDQLLGFSGISSQTDGNQNQNSPT